MSRCPLILALGLGILINPVGHERAAHATPVTAPGAETPPAAAPPASGTVVETMNSGGYTYLHVDTGAAKMWVAAPELDVATGDTVTIPDGLEMRDFHSKTMGRTFELLYLVASVHVKGRTKAPTPARIPHRAPASSEEAVAVDLSGIAKAKGGNTVGELFENKAALVGTPVTVRGKVVKFTPAIMGRNWLHVQDGTGTANGNDLVVTTQARASIGDTILVSGVLAADRDFGFGYKYDILIEDAEIDIE